MEPCTTCEGKGVYDSYDGDGRAFEFECYICNGTGKASRPTVDLGEDGELVARVERFAAELPAGDSVRLPSGNTLYGDDLRDLLRRAVLSRGGN